jgi:hypothetical protein
MYREYSKKPLGAKVNHRSHEESAVLASTAIALWHKEINPCSEGCILAKSGRTRTEILYYSRER